MDESINFLTSNSNNKIKKLQSHKIKMIKHGGDQRKLIQDKALTKRHCDHVPIFSCLLERQVKLLKGAAFSRVSARAVIGT